MACCTGKITQVIWLKKGVDILIDGENFFFLIDGLWSNCKASDSGMRGVCGYIITFGLTITITTVKVTQHAGQHSGHICQSIQTEKNNRNTTNQAN